MAPSRGHAHPQALRARVAAEAARILALHGGGDVAGARRKAAQRLGARHERDLPGTSEIEAALAEHRRLFGGGVGADRLHELRRAALEAMAFLAAFEPRLAGPVLDGSPGPGDAVRLFLHVDDGGEVLRALDAHGVRHDERGERQPLADGSVVLASVFGFEAGGVPFELVVLPLQALRQPPVSALERKPIARASIADLRRLLAAESGGG